MNPFENKDSDGGGGGGGGDSEVNGNMGELEKNVHVENNNEDLKEGDDDLGDENVLSDPEHTGAEVSEPGQVNPPRWSPFGVGVGAGGIADMAEIRACGQGGGFDPSQAAPLYGAHLAGQQQQHQQQQQQHRQQLQQQLQQQYCFQMMNEAAGGTSSSAMVRSPPAIDPMLAQHQDASDPDPLPPYDPQAFIPFTTGASFSPSGISLPCSVRGVKGLLGSDPALALSRERAARVAQQLPGGDYGLARAVAAGGGGGGGRRVGGAYAGCGSVDVGDGGSGAGGGGGGGGMSVGMNADQDHAGDSLDNEAVTVPTGK
nr:hypothetical protein BaRGS_029660 [Batillaria attramentaria]